ncbi:MAG TPA: hypothetical protein VIK18_07580 [Pirellulales bacterium]
MTSDDELRALKRRHSAQLWSNPNVSGVDIGVDEQGEPVFTVLLKTDDPQVRQSLPGKIEGHPVFYHYGPVEKQ